MIRSISIKKFDPEKNTEVNFMLTKALDGSDRGLFKRMYKRDFVTRVNEKRHQMTTFEAHVTKYGGDVINYTLNDGTIIWENEVDHKAIKKAIKWLKPEYLTYGYITGTASPVTKQGMQSASKINGYVIWVTAFKEIKS